MAKISTYPLASPVSLSDMVIGSDVVNSNVTKNFEVADILALSNNPTVLTAFVPYTGAVGNVNLGVNDLAVNYIQVADGIQAVNQISAATLDANLVEVYQELKITTGAVIDLDGNTGSAGDIMLSQGVGVTPIWETQATLFSNLVPYNGATANVDLGTNAIYAADGVFNNSVELEANVELILDGDTGSIGEVLLSQGSGNTPIWETQALFFANAVLTLPTYASNAAALAGGLIQGQLYASAAGVVSIVL